MTPPENLFHARRVGAPITSAHFLSIGLFTQICKRKNPSSYRPKNFVRSFYGFGTQPHRYASRRARALAVRALAQGWEKSRLFPAVHKKGGTDPPAGRGARPGLRNLED